MFEELDEAIFTAEGHLAMGRNKDVFQEAVDAMQKKLNKVPLNVPITEEKMDELRAEVEAEVRDPQAVSDRFIAFGRKFKEAIDAVKEAEKLYKVPLDFTKPDNINHPAHYTAYKGLEVIDLTEQMNFNRGNAVKHICRAGLKSPETEIEDLRKAKWYIDKEIDRLLREKSL